MISISPISLHIETRDQACCIGIRRLILDIDYASVVLFHAACLRLASESCSISASGVPFNGLTFLKQVKQIKNL